MDPGNTITFVVSVQNREGVLKDLSWNMNCKREEGRAFVRLRLWWSSRREQEGECKEKFIKEKRVAFHPSSVSEHQACFEGNTSQGYLWSEWEISEIHQFSLDGSLRLLLLFSLSLSHTMAHQDFHTPNNVRKGVEHRGQTFTCSCTTLFPTIFPSLFLQVIPATQAQTIFLASHLQKILELEDITSSVWGLNPYCCKWKPPSKL